MFHIKTVLDNDQSTNEAYSQINLFFIELYIAIFTWLPQITLTNCIALTGDNHDLVQYLPVLSLVDVMWKPTLEIFFGEVFSQTEVETVW